MRMIFKRIAICLLVLLFMGGAAVSAEETKQLVPMFLTGTLYIGDQIAPTGTILYADIDGVEPYAGIAEVIESGVYGSDIEPMMIQAGADESKEGSTVTFWVNGVEAVEKISYEPGTTLAIDIHAPGAAENKLTVIPQGGDVFIGEEGLDVSLFLKAGDKIAWFDPTSDSYLTEPRDTIVIDNPNRYFIDPAQFSGETGRWWIWSGDKAKELAFIVKEPSIALRIWNQDENQDINQDGGKIPAGNYVNFRIETNLYSAIMQRGFGLSPEELGIINLVGASNTTKVDYQMLRGKLNGVTDLDISLRDLVVDENPWYWPDNDKTNSGWDTGAVSSDNNRLYPNGEYDFYGEVTLNNIKNNYQGDPTGKTVSETIPAFIVDDSIDLVIDPGTVTRNSSFYVTVGGRPDTDYIIVIMQCAEGATDPTDCCALKMSGAPCDRPPQIRPDQSGVTESNIVFDPEDGPFVIGTVELSPDCCEKRGTIRDVVPTDTKPNARDVLANGIYYYALIHTDGDNDPTPGYRTVEFLANSDVLADRPYRIHVQSINSDVNKVIAGDGLVTVNKGEVTLEIAEEAPYFLGNDITLSGINTDSKYVYLYMTGSQCQNKCGNDLLYIKKADAEKNVIMPGIDMIRLGCVEEAEQFTCIQVPVKSDGTWKYVWRTQEAPINPGTYTVFASSQPVNACCLDCACAVTAMQDIILQEPEIQAVIDPSLITKPIECCPEGCSWTSLDKVMLTGKATGFPHVGEDLNVTKELNMWIFGDEKVGNDNYINAKIPVFCDDTFEVNLLNYFNLCDLKPGCYSVILQHPMYNHMFDMVKETDVRTPIDQNRVWMVTSYPDEWSKLFPLNGPGYYQGTKAVTGITDFLNQGLVDDKYLVLQFCVADDRIPTAAFTANPTEGNVPLEVQFTDQSTGKNLTQWYWEFGDATTSTTKNPKHTYSEAGTYTVSLTVMNVDGDTDTATKPDFIKARNPTISAAFSATPTSGVAPLKVQFTDASTGSPNNWFWDFGDGYTSAGVKNPDHTYQYGGNYSVTLTITLGEEVDRLTKTDYIRVVGGIHPTPTVTPINASFIQLYPGWNFVSVPRTLAEGKNTAGAIFREVPTGGHAIWAYEPYNQFWDQVLTGTIIQPLNGYWIYALSSYRVNLTFKNDPLEIPSTRNLPTGWAAIGFTGANPATAKDTLKSVVSSWIYARGFDASRQQWDPTIVNGGQGEGTYMYPSEGYWLYMESPGTLAAIGV